MVESKSLGTFQSVQKQDSHKGLFVDRGVGSPRLVKSPSATTFTDLKNDSEAKVCDSLYSVWNTPLTSLYNYVFLPAVFSYCSA